MRAALRPGARCTSGVSGGKHECSLSRAKTPESQRPTNPLGAEAKPPKTHSHLTGSIVLLVGQPEELNDLLLSGLMGVREAASVLHGIVCQGLKVLRLGAQLLDVLGDLDPLVEVPDGRQDALHGFVLVLANLGEAHRVRNVNEQLRHVLGVVCLHHGQEHSVADAVRRVVEAAELVGHGVHVAQACGVEGHACQELGGRHHVPGLHVGAVLDGLGQVRSNEPHRVQRVCVGDGIGRRAHVGLDGVRQGIHSGGRRQAFGHADHELGVVHRDGGREAPIHECHLHMPDLVRDNAESCHLGRCASGGVNRHQGQHGLLALVHALVVLDAAAVGG
mmetsp:Transcript_89944/g.279947  ORF Transcript_89944/g.279947 Transcript_89944/m.279947 type:complete len:333 (-) Transcript_89944:584-1582(-)